MVSASHGVPSPLTLAPIQLPSAEQVSANNRIFVEAVLWIARTASPWRDLPAPCGLTSMRRAQKGDPKSGPRPLARGLTSKIHLAVRGLGLPVRLLLTAGQRNDITQAQALVAGLPAEQVIADTAYDADHFRRDIAATGAQAVILSHPARARKLPPDTALYKERHLVECCLNKLKHFRRVATRYEKPPETSSPSSASQPPSFGCDDCQQVLGGAGMTTPGGSQ